MVVPLNFQNGDFAQTLVGKYLYKVSSPSGQFLPVTNLFTVTNAFFSSYLTGAVVNTESSGPGTETNIPIPNAIVLLCLNQGGPLVVQAGTVADKSGNFSLRAPPGDYFFAAGKSNFVEDTSQAGSINLAAKFTNSSPIDISLTPSTTNITGRVINAANTNGLAGLSGMAISTNGLLSFYFTDTNGFFYAPVVANLWEGPVDGFAAAFQGCFVSATNLLLNVSNKVVNFTNALPPVSAIFYGVVSNSSAVPMPGVYLYANDNAGHQSVGMSDSHGKYVVGVSAGTNQWILYIPPTENPGLTNPFVINPLFLQTSVLQTDEALQVNFSLEHAPDTISGTVADVDGNPISGAVVFAGNTNYQAFSAVTASDGTYSLNVSSGTWTIGVTPASLESLGYTNLADFPPNQTVSVSDSSPNVTVNFSLLVCGEIDITTTNLPDAMAGQYYDSSLQATSCQSITNWSTAYGITLTSLYDHTNVTYPAGTPIYSNSGIIGFLKTFVTFGVANDQEFTSNVTATLETENGGEERYYFANISATINLTGPIAHTNQIQFGQNAVWTASPTTQNADGSYSTTVTLSRWPSGSGYWFVNGSFISSAMVVNNSGGISNRVASVASAFHSIPTVGNSTIAASSIPYTNLDNSVVWIQYGTNLGQYFISAYGPQTNNLDGLTLYPDGTLAGTPINNGTFNFSVMAEDANSDVTVQPLSLTVFPATGLTAPSSAQAGWVQSSNIFQMQLTGLNSALNYTVLMNTNLSSTNWVPIYTVNNPSTNVMAIPDTAATNATRFYRVQISQ